MFNTFRTLFKLPVLLINLLLIGFRLIDLHLATARPPTCLTTLIPLLPLGPIVGRDVTS